MKSPNVLCILLVSQVFKTSKFVYDHEVVKSYFDADPVSVTEALGSPLKRRVSLDAQVTKVTVCFNVFNTVVIVVCVCESVCKCIR